MSVESPFIGKYTVPHPNTKLIFSPKNKHAWMEFCSSGLDEPLKKRVRMYMDAGGLAGLLRGKYGGRVSKEVIEKAALRASFGPDRMCREMQMIKNYQTPERPDPK